MCKEPRHKPHFPSTAGEGSGPQDIHLILHQLLISRSLWMTTVTTVIHSLVGYMTKPAPYLTFGRTWHIVCWTISGYKWGNAATKVWIGAGGRRRCVLRRTYLFRHLIPHSDRKHPECGDTHAEWVHRCLGRGGLKPPELRRKQWDLSADDMEVRGHRENTKIGCMVINRLASATSLRAANAVAAFPN